MIKIYNTLSRQKEELKPIHAGKIGMYVCGVTVYDYCHLGHARTYTSADVIFRYLTWHGFQVNYVRNITDIDDKIIKRANENKEGFNSVTERFTKAMHEDFDALGLLSPHHEPKATDYVPQMITLIEQMIANDHAYVADNGDVYFDVRRINDYGCLSHHDIDQLESGARVDVIEAKRDPLDFVLWKLAKPNEPFWDSPWGAGRPGWHTECVVMSRHLLGEHFDIHGGGRDLIFPHHENELAQAHAVSDSSFTNVWVHGGFLQIDKEKMSKSLGNFVTIRDVLREHNAEVIRYFLLASHYRSPLIYTNDVIEQTKQSLTRLYMALRFLSLSEPAQHTSYEEQFIAAMDDDFNTPIALSVLFDLAHEIQRIRDHDLTRAQEYGALLRQLGQVLGILQTDPERYFQLGHQIDVAKIEDLIEKRKQARLNKDWALADRIRVELTNMNVIIEDNAQGTSWRRG